MSPQITQFSLQLLRIIFQNCLFSGKHLRLVCQLWNNVLLSLPESKLYLCREPVEHGRTENYHYDDSPNFQLLCLTMESRLARSIVFNEDIHIQRNVPNSYVPLTATASKFIHFCDKFSKHIERIRIAPVRNLEIFPNQEYVLFSTLSRCCPNLKSIYLNLETFEKHCSLGSKRSTSPQFLGCQPLHRPNLTNITVMCDPYVKNPCALTQLLVSSAPNLANLFLSCNNFPALDTCKSLQSLEIYCHNGIARTLVNFVQLEMMLSHVAPNLVSLSFTRPECSDDFSDNFCYSTGISSLKKNSFKIPRMPNLVEFRNELIDVFPCGESLEDISAMRMPSLKKLTFHNSHVEERDKCVDDLLANVVTRKDYFSWEGIGVTNLKTSEIRNPKYISMLKTPFPHLTKLVVDSDRLKFEETMQACASLGLVQLKLSIQHADKLSDLIRIFANNSTTLFRSKFNFVIFIISNVRKPVNFVEFCKLCNFF